MKHVLTSTTILLLLYVFLTSSSPLKAIATKAAEKAKSDSVVDPKKKYQDITKDAKTLNGLFTTHFTNKNKLYFEMSESAMQHTYLLANRIASTSDTQDYVAGQMATNPLVIRFTRDSVNIYMHKVQTGNEVEEGSSIEVSFKKNFVDPVLKGFPIETTNDGNIVFDVTSFFGDNERAISPIKQESPLAKLFGGRPSLKGAFVAGASNIQEVKTFKKNVEVRSMLSYNTTPLNEPYTVIVNRSLIVLPDTLMQKRIQDNRVGYFSTDRKFYTTQQDKVVPYTFIHRWRLEPKDEDFAAYFRGELVEPKEPIVFYVDNAFPEKWVNTIKQGVEDWNMAFEKAGFKNAIKAKDYPTDDPEFDPDDMRYSCIKYATTSIANAMGPSHVDPRSGEILTADVIWYHNILSLLHNWRFTQTAAIDSRVRKPVFDDDVMNESLRYVASHEIGHTLGLMHNMGASYSFPVDSLRSPSFTQTYGTTPSIMDYARNNYIAQPGDLEKGVKLTPPILGVYDIHAINWGYRLIPNVVKSEEEIATLNKWIEEKKHDPMYEFGAQQFFGLIDPTDQTEDLGNDHIKAGDLSISNLKIIMANLESWGGESGKRYDDLESVYKEVVNQYNRHVRHVLPYIGGVEFKEIRQGENPSVAAKTHISKNEQQRAMKWLMEQIRTSNSWLTPADLVMKLGTGFDVNSKLQTSVVGGLFNAGTLYRIAEGEKVDPKNNYTLNDYMDDVISEVFKATINNKALNTDEINIQTTALTLLLKNGGLKAAAPAKSFLGAYEEFMMAHGDSSLPCSHAALENSEHSKSFLRINFGLPTLPAPELNSLMTAQLNKVLELYKKRRNSSDTTTRNFYNYQIINIEKVLSTK